MDSWKQHPAQQSLQESEQLLRLIVENAPVGILTVEPGGEIHSVNPHLCKLLGFSAQELLGRNVDDLLHPEDRNLGDPEVDQLLQGAIPHYDLEARIIGKDGREIIADFHVNLVRDSSGEPQLLVGQIQDITARKAAQEERRQREELLRLTIENAPICLGITDGKRRLSHANPAFCAMLGYSKQELESMTVDAITHPQDISETKRHMDSLWHGASDHYMVEKRFLRKDGTTVHCQSHVSMVRSAEGKPLMTIGQVVDITERVKAEREMQRMRTYLSNMIDSMPSMLIAVDRNRVVTQWNRVAQETTGIAASKALGHPIDEVFPVDEVQSGQISEAILSGKPVKAGRLPVTFRGENRLVDALAYPLMAEEVVGAVVRLDDVTDQVRMQEMMVQTEKMLSVGGLAAGMAHEINNPLGAILQGCQNIQRRLSESLPANQKVAQSLELDLAVLRTYLESRNIPQFLERIQEAGERASKIVKDMLSFSRRSELHYEAVDIGELLDKSVRLASSDFDLKKEYDIKQVEIVRDYDPGLTAVECDRTEIEQVILNLIVNAAQAMAMHPQPGTAPKIILRALADGDHARLEIIDNGPGMNEKTRRRIFEPFFTTKEVGIGTGLGLSVSYFIIYDQHKGSLRVESSPGKGCRFIIRLPLRQA
jgi:PAS domain S-box-containing protein